MLVICGSFLSFVDFINLNVMLSEGLNALLDCIDAKLEVATDGQLLKAEGIC